MTALEKCSTDAAKPFDEVLRAALKISQKMLEQAEPAEPLQPAAPAPVSVVPFIAQLNTPAPALASQPAPAQDATPSTAPDSTSVPAPRRVLRTALPLAMASARKRAARESVSPTPTVAEDNEQNNADEFVCEFAGCGRSYEHKGSRTRHYKINHGGRRP
ncbi:hypothetical protein CORC01_12579 [Colletotrichum orchidophilum]|uniref:C2H2-type domain-containing protein n=1 Tax=Colletotrichum orchidophilum TaxID=1209926 RepID=A0A1G4ASH4_9PEZI|nr:uncharacterized protein CORC01_12579 [Colletotrichum orchidophilum]OHE92124.1 hypothetical protein CORC01_12579 [Colletotrichum orchidophilum]